MKKTMTVFGASVLAGALACGGGEDAGRDELDGMDEMEPSPEMIQDSMAADSTEEGMPVEMLDDGSVLEDEMGGGV